jgi:hypothetical protein
MVDDFTMRVGTNYEIDVITTLYSAAVAKDISSALIVCEFSNATGSIVLTKKTTDASPEVTITTNPLASAVTTPCTAAIKIVPADAQYLVPGSYTYEVSATISGARQVIYPLGDDTASFTVYDSKTWNVATHEPLEPNPMHPAVRKAAVLNAARRKT